MMLWEACERNSSYSLIPSSFFKLSSAITMLGEESAFRTFVRCVLVWICRFPFPLGVWEGLRFVIVALPGLFSFLFFHHGLKVRMSLGYNPHVNFCYFFLLFPLRFFFRPHYDQNTHLSQLLQFSTDYH